MNSLIYFNIRLVIAGMLLIVGAYLVWGIIPSRLRGSIFDSSRKCIGLAIMIMPLSTLLVYSLSLREVGHNLHIALYLTACYTISILVTVGFVPLLGGKFDYRQWRFIRGLISIPFFAAPMILANIYGGARLVNAAKILTIFLLMVTIAYQSYIFVIHYREAVTRSNNYYSDDVEVDISWIIKSVIAFFIMEMVCALSTFFPGMSFNAELLLTIYRVLTILYVFNQFVDFMMHFETMIGVCYKEPTEEDNKPDTYYRSLTDEQKTQISKRLDAWIAKRGYTQSGVTIDDVASEVITNRTYLSVYINTTFSCSFKVWITSLRVALAKEMLVASDDTTIDIARNVGFASAQSFMHSFKRSEGCTPTQWRKNGLSEVNVTKAEV